jgi:hypothetical protein
MRAWEQPSAQLHRQLKTQESETKKSGLNFEDQEKAFGAGRLSRESDGVHGAWNAHENCKKKHKHDTRNHT